MKRLFVILVLVFTAVLLVITTKVVYADHVRQTEWENTREVITIYVQSGDSVDGYWVKYAPDWMSKEQYREEFRELNNTSSCALYKGDRVKVYVEEGSK